jgi:hypothetical protein
MMGCNGFINKEDVLEYVFVDKDTGKILKSNIYAQEFIRDTFTILLSCAGVEIKYYTDDKLWEKFKGDLPDNINGEVLLFFNTSDAIKTIETISERIKRDRY